MGGVCFLVLVSLNATCQGHGALSCFMVLCRVLWCFVVFYGALSCFYFPPCFRAPYQKCRLSIFASCTCHINLRLLRGRSEAEGPYAQKISKCPRSLFSGFLNISYLVSAAGLWAKN